VSVLYIVELCSVWFQFLTSFFKKKMSKVYNIFYDEDEALLAVDTLCQEGHVEYCPCYTVDCVGNRKEFVVYSCGKSGMECQVEHICSRVEDGDVYEEARKLRENGHTCVCIGERSPPFLSWCHSSICTHKK